jgi:hypothetical protein
MSNPKLNQHLYLLRVLVSNIRVAACRTGMRMLGESPGAAEGKSGAVPPYPRRYLQQLCDSQLLLQAKAILRMRKVPP